MTEPTNAAYAAGFRELADWLEAHPAAPMPLSFRVLVPLTTNESVERFAAANGCESAVDKDGNAYSEIQFGPITYWAFGYADKDAFFDQLDEERARIWAEGKGLTIQPATAEREDGECRARRYGGPENCGCTDCVERVGEQAANEV